jgi:hypothetical protein
MKKTFVVLVVVMCGFATGALAQVDSSHPGYYPIEEMGLFAADDLEVNIDLQGAMLQVAAGVMQKDGEDADLAELASKLERVRVQVGSPKRIDTAAISSSFDGAVKSMEGAGWNKILSVIEDDAQVYLFARERGGAIVGLTVLVNDDDDELVLANVVGTIDPVLLGRVIAKMDKLPNLETYMDIAE